MTKTVVRSTSKLVPGFTLALLISLGPLSLCAQATQPPAAGLQEAFARYQAGDYPGAEGILESLLAISPGNVRAWRLLGASRIQTKEYEKARDAYLKALAIEPDFPVALYNAGVAYARLGKNDEAFAWLSKAKATRKLDISQIEVDADLASLKGDPRFAALLPTAADFDKPFVEPVKIIREFDGESAGDQFGWIARKIGDVDGDHVPDFVTSAPTKDIGGASAGRIYVYSSKSGRLLWTADGKPGDTLGTGVEGAGDTNHDGVPDVIAGAPGGGYANIYSGKDGRVIRTLTAEEKNDDFGRHCAGVGDVDHDGYGDVLVGAPGNNAGGKGAGRAYVYSGKDGHVLLTLTGEGEGDGFGSTVGGATTKGKFLLIVGAPGAGPKKTGRTYVYDALSTKPKFVIDADETGSALGQMFVSVPGDVDGDHVPDVYASDWANNAKGPSTGRIYVYSGKDGKMLLTLTGETAGEGFGTCPATAGDVDHDGHADLIVGAWQYAGAAVSGGRAYLYSGKDGHLMKTYTCRILGDTFGFDAVGMGDVDGDGTVDFLITSAWSAVKGYHSGRLFIISSGVK